MGSFPFRHGLALLVAKPIANAAAAPPVTRPPGTLPPPAAPKCAVSAAALRRTVRRSMRPPIHSSGSNWSPQVILGWPPLFLRVGTVLVLNQIQVSLSLSLYSFGVLWISILRCALLVQIHPSIHVLARFVCFFRLRIDTLDLLPVHCSLFSKQNCRDSAETSADSANFCVVHAESI